MKTVYFAALLGIIFTISNTLPAANYKPTKYIVFEHVGITDKPINTVIIAQEKSTLPSSLSKTYSLNKLYFKYFINNKLYKKTETIVKNAKKSRQTYEFGNFKILIADGNKKSISFIAREDAVSLFNSLRTLYQREKLNTELPLMLDELKTRIYY